MSNFKEELNKVTKTPNQFKQEQDLKEKEQAKYSAGIHYCIIKDELLKKAKQGKYTISSTNKKIEYDFYYNQDPSFIRKISERIYINKTIFNPGGESANKLLIYISNENYYNAYISQIKKLALEDDILITPLILNKYNNEIYSIPFSIQGFGVFDFDYKFILRCAVEY